MSFSSRDLAFLAAKDAAFVKAQDKHTQAFGALLETAHLESRITRLSKEADRLKRDLLAENHIESAACIDMAAAAIEDAKEALK